MKRFILLCIALMGNIHASVYFSKKRVDFICSDPLKMLPSIYQAHVIDVADLNLWKEKFEISDIVLADDVQEVINISNLFQSYGDKSSLAMVVNVETKVVCALLKYNEQCGDEILVSALATNPQYRNQGLAQILIQLIEFLSSKNPNIQHISILVNPNNEKIITFYKALGYQPEIVD